MLIEEPHEHVAIEPPDAVLAAQDAQRARPRTCAGEVPDDALDGVHALVEIRPRPRVRAGGARRRRRREELEHPQRLVAVGEAVMPGVAAEEDALARLGANDLARLRVGEHERPLQNVEQLVGGEHRPEAVRVAERAARLQAEDDHVDLLRGDVDPVLDEAGRLVAPGVPDGVGRADHRRRLERRSRRGLIAHRGSGGRERARRRAPRTTRRRPGRGSRSRSCGRRRRGPRPVPPA